MVYRATTMRVPSMCHSHHCSRPSCWAHQGSGDGWGARSCASRTRSTTCSGGYSCPSCTAPSGWSARGHHCTHNTTYSLSSHSEAALVAMVGALVVVLTRSLICVALYTPTCKIASSSVHHKCTNSKADAVYICEWLQRRNNQQNNAAQQAMWDTWVDC